MTIDPTMAVNGLGSAEWQIGGVDAPAPTTQAGKGFSSMLSIDPAFADNQTKPRARLSRSPRARLPTRPRSSWPSSARSSRCRWPARSARRPSRPPRPSSRPRSDLTHAALHPEPPRAPRQDEGILAVSAVAILGIAFIMLKIATAPAYSTIASGLDPAQTGKITAALDEQGIAYEIQNNGTALAVHEGVDGAGAHRAGLAGCRGFRRRHAAGLRAARREQARRLPVPAAGHLPACAGG